MKKGILLLLSVVAFALLSTTQLSKAAGGSGSGTDHGFWYSYWYLNGNYSLTFPYAGTYAGNSLETYSSSGDCLGGKGWSTGFAGNANYNCTFANISCFGVYGWTHAPVIEYYISDFGGQGGTTVGTVNSDGANYTSYVTYCPNGNSIEGTMNYYQYKDMRQSQNSQNANHTINTANHINYWKAHDTHGWGSQGYHEMKLQAECWTGASGNCGSTIW